MSWFRMKVPEGSRASGAGKLRGVQTRLNLITPGNTPVRRAGHLKNMRGMCERSCCLGKQDDLVLWLYLRSLRQADVCAFEFNDNFMHERASLLDSKHPLPR